MRGRSIIAFLLVAGAAVADQPESPAGIDPQPSAARAEGRGAVPESTRDLAMLDRRLTVLENKSPPAWYVPFVLTLLSTGFGIAVGSLITARYTHRAEARADRLRREDAAISVASEWIKMFPSLQHVYKCLDSPDLLREAKNLNAVLDYGNWLETTAQRLGHQLIDRDLLKKMGLIDRMSVFVGKYDHAAGILASAQPALDIRLYSGAWTALGEQVSKEKGGEICHHKTV
ncbi:MAG: hypothetical protein CTY28_12520 [Hyphomicrobium sp.]|nr:MAG: hypothetical protein CTY28_12520 [Hyphomicrobium sp.]